MQLLSRRHALFAGLLGPACSRSRRRLIGVAPKAVSHLFFQSVHAGVKAAASEHNVDILWNGPQEETDYGRQIQIIDAMVARRVDAIAISATERTALAAPVKRAAAAGIPITVFDSGLEFEDYVTFVATDNRGAGETAARKLAALVPGEGKVAMLMHKPGGQSTGDRESGFEEVLRREFPHIKLAAKQYGMADRARSRAAAENILTANPDLDGIFASAEANSLGAIQALESRGLAGKVRLVTFDTSETHVAALEKGTIDLMLVQDSYRIGFEAVNSLIRKLHGETPAKRLHLPPHLITKADLNRPEIRKVISPEWVKGQ